jgi:hypothetical protein
MLWIGFMMVMMMVVVMVVVAMTMSMAMCMMSVVKEMVSSFTFGIWCGFILIITSFSVVVMVSVVPGIGFVWDVDVGVIGTCVLTMFDLVLVQVW